MHLQQEYDYLTDEDISHKIRNRGLVTMNHQ